MGRARVSSRAHGAIMSSQGFLPPRQATSAPASDETSGGVLDSLQDLVGNSGLLSLLPGHETTGASAAAGCDHAHGHDHAVAPRPGGGGIFGLSTGEIVGGVLGGIILGPG